MNESYFSDHQDDLPFFYKFFKLGANISMKNLVGFNKDKRLQRYTSSIAIMEEFFQIRLHYYQKRKDYLISRLERDLQILSNKERFILEIVEEKLIIRNKKKVKIV